MDIIGWNTIRIDWKLTSSHTFEAMEMCSEGITLIRPLVSSFINLNMTFGNGNEVASFMIAFSNFSWTDLVAALNCVDVVYGIIT